jgi:hypothetical protein
MSSVKQKKQDQYPRGSGTGFHKSMNKSPATESISQLETQPISPKKQAANVKEMHYDRLPPNRQALSSIISQPERRPISQEQLVAEVKGLYAGLVMVEGKCIQVDLSNHNWLGKENLN